MKYYTLLLLGLICTASFSQEAVFYVRKPSFHFSKIDEGQIVEHTFIIENKGDIPLEILSYEVECSCTSLTYESNAILPGKSMPLTLRFDSSGKKGLQNRYITLNTNTKRVTEQLHFEVFVRGGK